MRWINVAVIALIVVAPLCADPGDGSKFGYNPTRMELAQAMSQPQEEPATPSDASMPAEGKLVPGKALLLSAILPGAGQYYAKSPLMAAAFLAIEVGAWAGVAIYHADGMDKEDEFIAYANQYWVYDDPTGGSFGSYFQYEYWAASMFGYDGESTTSADNYPQGPDSWAGLSWDDKLDYLPKDGFTHELIPTDKDQQYYEMIGKYDQFAPGWPDYLEDDETTWQANDNVSPKRNKYLDLRKQSNDALDMSKNFTMVVLANHLASALHAGFSVSLHNRKMAKEQKIEGAFRLQSKRINSEYVTMGGLQVTF